MCWLLRSFHVRILCIEGATEHLDFLLHVIYYLPTMCYCIRQHFLANSESLPTIHMRDACVMMTRERFIENFNLFLSSAVLFALSPSSLSFSLSLLKDLLLFLSLALHYCKSPKRTLTQNPLIPASSLIGMSRAPPMMGHKMNFNILSLSLCIDVEKRTSVAFVVCMLFNVSVCTEIFSRPIFHSIQLCRQFNLKF